MVKRQGLTRIAGSVDNVDEDERIVEDIHRGSELAMTYVTNYNPPLPFVEGRGQG